MHVTLADFGGGIEEPEIPSIDELEDLDDKMREELAMLYAQQPDLFSQ